MKQIGFLTLVILFSITQTQAQTSKNKDEMVFEKTFNGITGHNFGSIALGSDGKVDFTFTNKGKKPLLITEVKSTCGCTIPTWSKEPVAPGAQGTVTILYNTNLPGPFNKTVVVTSNANNSPVRLVVMGKVGVQMKDVDAINQNNNSNANGGNKMLNENSDEQKASIKRQPPTTLPTQVSATPPATVKQTDVNVNKKK